MKAAGQLVMLAGLEEKRPPARSALREGLLVMPAIALMFVLGVCPQLLIGLFNATMTQLAEHLKY